MRMAFGSPEIGDAERKDTARLYFNGVEHLRLLFDLRLLKLLATEVNCCWWHTQHRSSATRMVQGLRRSFISENVSLL